MAKVLVSDLDGTLLYPKKRIRFISKENITLIKDFVDQGNHFVIASGRDENFARKAIKRIGRPLTYIGCNSAFIMKNNEVLKETFFEVNDIYKIMDLIDERFKITTYVIMTPDDKVLIYPKRWRLFFRSFYWIYVASQGVIRDSYRMIGKKRFEEEIKKGRTLKFMAFTGLGHKASVKASIVTRYLRETFSEIESSWSSISCEISPRGVNKAAGIDWLVKTYGFNPDEIYVVGDSGNDIDMFKQYYQNSFCMEHSKPSIKKYAKHTVESVSDLRDYILKNPKTEKGR